MSKHYNSTRSAFTHIQLKEESKAQMSYNRLAVLLSILAFVWFLCHLAEVQFPSRHIMDTYDRIGEKNVTKQAVKHTVQLLLGSRTPEQTRYWQYLSTKYSIQKQQQQQICIILHHEPTPQTPSSSSSSSSSHLKQKQQPSSSQPTQPQYMKSISSLLSQNYTDYKIYYLNNQKAGQEIYTFLQNNALDKRKINLVQDFEDNDYTKQFDYSKVYCGDGDIVVYMVDDDVLVSKDVLAFVNAIYAAQPSLQLMYTASLIAQPKQRNKKFTYKLGKSYQYPNAVVENGTYRNFPYIIDGLLTFKVSVYDQIQIKDMLNSSNNPYQHIADIALGTALLKAANGKIRYLPQPVLVRGRQRSYIMIDDAKIKRQMADLRKK